MSKSSKSDRATGVLKTTAFERPAAKGPAEEPLRQALGYERGDRRIGCADVQPTPRAPYGVEFASF
jgi:hypothetical protein